MGKPTKASQKTKITMLLSRGNWLTLPEICESLGGYVLQTTASMWIRKIRRELDGTDFELKSRLRGNSKRLWEHTIVKRELGNLSLFGDSHAA